MPIPNKAVLLTTELLLLILENAQGILLNLLRRVPKAKSFVNDAVREKELGWGEINMKMPASSFQILEDLAINYLNTRKRLYVVDGFAGWDPEERVKIRVVTTRAYHALFMHNMLVRPTLQ